VLARVISQFQVIVLGESIVLSCLCLLELYATGVGLKKAPRRQEREGRVSEDKKEAIQSESSRVKLIDTVPQ
jgi:hypothetical protein